VAWCLWTQKKFPAGAAGAGSGSGSGVLAKCAFRAYSFRDTAKPFSCFRIAEGIEFQRGASWLQAYGRDILLSVWFLSSPAVQRGSAESVSFNLLHKSDNSRIKQITFCQAEDKAIPRSELVKGFEYEKDHYVVIEDDEIKKVAPKTAKVMEILEFVETKDVDPVYLESSYYMAPEGGGEKAYALLFEALRKSGYSGVAKIAMHNREHIVILRPGQRGILLHTMYFTNEIRQVDEFRTDLDLVKEKELTLAHTLIEAFGGEV